MLTDRRAHFKVGLSTLYLPFYERLCQVLGPEWQPYSGVRTFDQQTTLYNQGRVTPGKIVTRAKAGHSAHNYGCATDWTIFDEKGQPIWFKEGDPRRQIYIEAVRAVGLEPGSNFGDDDHNQLKLTCSWSHIYLVLVSGNPILAQQKIEESMVK